MVSKVIRSTVLAVDGVLGLVFLYLLAALLPGDQMNASVEGSLVLMAAVVAIIAAVTLPGRAYLRRRGSDLFEGIEWW
jgi:hypothetical protein